MRNVWTVVSVTLTTVLAANCRTAAPTGVRESDLADATSPAATATAMSELQPASDDYVEQLLGRFEQDMATAMEADVEKFDRSGVKREEMPQFFKSEEIAGKDFVTAKDKWRVTKILCAKERDPSVCLTEDGGRAAINPNDKAEQLVDNGTALVNTLEKMEQHNLKSAQLAASPWSDDYWAIYTGILGKRYADPNFPQSVDWKENRDYALTQAPAANVNDPNQLSPSEKYDLVMGDNAFSLTQSHWLEGQAYYERSGSVETWMGICHGWAPAAYMLGRPVKTVTLKTPAGQDVVFYPSDIKAMGTALYANGGVNAKAIGGRCNDKDPPKDANGRIKYERCFDNNPGAWHMAVVNQLGVAKRSMVLDVTYDYEVWNQPLLGYRYRYFDPKTKKIKASIAAATRPLPMAGDKFKSYRGAAAKKLVGIAMDVWYVVETSPNQEPTDSEAADAVTRVTYTYDLELDASGKIVGGEWYSNKHPDFLWTPTPNFRVATAGDGLATGEWNPSAPLPANWRNGGRLDGKSGLPMGKFVYELYKQAAQSPVN